MTEKCLTNLAESPPLDIIHFIVINEHPFRIACNYLGSCFNTAYRISRRCSLIFSEILVLFSDRVLVCSLGCSLSRRRVCGPVPSIRDTKSNCYYFDEDMATIGAQVLEDIDKD